MRPTCNDAIMLLTDGAPSEAAETLKTLNQNRENKVRSGRKKRIIYFFTGPVLKISFIQVRIFTYLIGQEATEFQQVFPRIWIFPLLGNFKM